MDKTRPQAYVAMVTKGMLLCRGEQGRGQLATLLAGQVFSQNQGHRVTPQDEDESSFPSLQSTHFLYFFLFFKKNFIYLKQTFGLSGRRRGWDDLSEERWNIYITICKIDDQCEFAVSCRAPKAGALTTWRDWVGERGVQDEEDTCIPVADSYWCMAKTITIL